MLRRRLLYTLGLAWLMVGSAMAQTGQIDSFDGASGWSNAVASSGADPIKEGAGSLKILAGTEQVEATKASYHLNIPHDNAHFIQFWLYGDGSGNEVQMLFYDKNQNAARFIQSMSWSGWLPVVIETDMISADDAARCDFTQITRIDFIVTVGNNRRGDVFVDDLRLVDTPTLPLAIARFDPDPWCEILGGGDGIGSIAFDTTEKTEGKSSYRMQFTSTAYNQVSVVFNHYQQEVKRMIKNLTPYKYLTFDLNGDNSGKYLQMRFMTGGSFYHKDIRVDWTGWKHFHLPRAAFTLGGGAADWARIDALRMVNPSGGPMDIRIDNVFATNSPPPPSAAVVENAAHLTITVDGNPSDWNWDACQPIQIATAHGTGLAADIRTAWDDTYLYFLIEEAGNDSRKQEAATPAAYAAAGDYDGVALWIDLDDSNDGQWDVNPRFGFSSDGVSGLMAARVNNVDNWSVGAAALANATVKTSGSQAQHNRIIEACLKWSDLAGAVSADRQPVGGLMNAIAYGYRFGCDPLLIDNDASGQTFIGGDPSNAPVGSDADSRDIRLASEVPVELSNYSIE